MCGDPKNCLHSRLENNMASVKLLINTVPAKQPFVTIIVIKKQSENQQKIKENQSL